MSAIFVHTSARTSDEHRSNTQRKVTWGRIFDIRKVSQRSSAEGRRPTKWLITRNQSAFTE